MKLATYYLLAVAIAGLIPHQYTYARTGEPLQGYCAVAKMDAELTGSIGGNLKTICP